jgi:two-component sensor histidine kinase
MTKVVTTVANGVIAQSNRHQAIADKTVGFIGLSKKGGAFERGAFEKGTRYRERHAAPMLTLDPRSSLPGVPCSEPNPVRQNADNDGVRRRPAGGGARPGIEIEMQDLSPRPAAMPVGRVGAPIAAAAASLALIVALAVASASLPGGAIAGIAAAAAGLTVFLGVGWCRSIRRNARLADALDLAAVKRQDDARTLAEAGATADQQHALIIEMRHRASNHLQTIASMLALQVRQSDDTAVRRALSEAADRVNTVGQAQRRLYRGDAAEFDLADYLEGLCTDLAGVYGLACQSAVEPAGVAHAKAALPLALILQELVSNAARHGARDGAMPRVAVHLRRDEGDAIALTIEDDGVGLPPGFSPETHARFGLTLAKSMAAQLRGTMAMDRISEQGGTRVTIIGHLPSAA